MTKRRNSKSKMGLLKGTVVAGGLLATMLGTNLLARNDAQVSAAELSIDTAASAVEQPRIEAPKWQGVLAAIPTLVAPAEIMPAQGISRTNRVETARQFDPIPQVAAPALPIQPAASVVDASQVLSFDLGQIPTVVIPPPVANSKSSR